MSNPIQLNPSKWNEWHFCISAPYMRKIMLATNKKKPLKGNTTAPQYNIRGCQKQLSMHIQYNYSNLEASQASN